MKGYTINPQFCLDNGTPAGVNVQIYSEFSPDYWESEERFETLEEAELFVRDMVLVDGQIEKINYIPTHNEAILEMRLAVLKQDLLRCETNFTGELREVFILLHGRAPHESKI